MSTNYPNYLVEESYDSRSADVGESNSIDLDYYVFYVGSGTADDTDAHASVAVDTAPDRYRSLPKRTSSLKQLTPTLFHVTVGYGMELNQAQPAETNSQGQITAFNSVLTFNLIGGTTHITTALGTDSYAAPGETLVDIKKTIGLDIKNGNVKGLDVFAPVLDFSRTAQFPKAIVTNDYILSLFRMTPCTNDATFFEFERGEVLFKGARGSQRGSDNWEISFEFAFSENVNDFVIPCENGDLIIPGKDGWQYLEVLYKDGTNTIGGRPVQVPSQVNVHTIFKEKSFSQLKIGSQ